MATRAIVTTQKTENFQSCLKEYFVLKFIKALPDTKSQKIIHAPIHDNKKLISPLISAPNQREVRITATIPQATANAFDIKE